MVQEKRLDSLGTFIPAHSFFKTIAIDAENFGFTTQLLHNASTLATTQHVEEKLSADDLQIIQMVNALDDFIQTSNLLAERLECWNVLPNAKDRYQPVERAYDLITTEMKQLEKQIEQNMQTVAPNISTIVGPLIGARLLSLAGSIERLAVMPASTIQLLGAEKALFRFKKEGGKPPKHGVIFQHPLVNKAPRSIRGRISRTLASTIAIAAKADAFTKRDIAATLKQEMEKRIQEIQNL
ncbi:MAG: RNA-binding protein [Candidatus Thermoplasmatota archaeon]|nr:RNA-binding protein [Candidatus Thermoplasmatota archaeon]